MSEYTVLKKGIFDSVRADFPFAEQYIIARKDDKKLLLVRIFNPLDKTVDGVKVSVKTYDKDGQLVSEDMYSYVLTCAGMSRAPLPQEIQIDEKAVSCEVEVKTVAAGGDTFVASGKRVRPIYDDAFSQKSDVAGVAKKERTQSTVVEKPGRLLLFVVACFMLVVMLVTMFALNEYVKTHDEFSISNVEYRFLNPAERDGSIVVTGYNGTARNIVIPEQIEDHAVVAIDDGAFAYNGNVRSITIEANVSVAKNAFANCYMLEKVTMKNPLGIGEGAFDSCVNLRSVEIENSSNIKYIFADTFKGCGALKSFDIPQSVMSIADSAFEGCFSLESVSFPSQLRTIGNYVFRNCSALKKIDIPSSVVNIGWDVFSGCDAVTEMSFSRSYGRAFYSLFGDEWSVSPALAKITYKGDAVEPWMFSNLNVQTISLPNVTKIDEYAFSNCSLLESVSLSKNLTHIGSSAFANCQNLRQVNIPQGVNHIGSSAFYCCYNLESVSLPYSIMSIEDYTFYNCSSLRDLILPDTIQYIGCSAFESCSSLTKLIVPDRVEHIEANALIGCDSLEELSLPMMSGSLAEVFGGYDYNQSYVVPYSLKKVTVKSETIAPYAFAYLSWLEQVSIPNATSIGEYAFSQCTSIANIELSQDLQTIGEYAFEQCTSLTEIAIPAGVTRIENDTFSNCNSLMYVDTIADLTYIGERAFTNCSRLASINLGNALVELGSYAFSNCTSLAEVSLPATVTTIDNSAFANCSSLASINLGNALVELGSYAFSNCTSLAEVSLPSTVTTIGNNAFENCTSLTSFTIPYSATSVGVGVLSGCSALEELTMPQVFGGHLVYVFGSYNGYVDNFLIPSNLKTVRVTGTDVAGYAFYYCSIESVEIDNVTNIGENAFYGSSIKNIDLPRSLQSIGRGAFSYCSSLQSVVLPQGIAYLDEYVFMGCSSLRSVVLPQSLSDIGYNAFWECNRLYEIYNLSSLPLSVGSYDYGYVAYYAKVIHTSLDEDPAMVVTTDENVELIRIGDQYYATKYVGNEAELTLADLHYDDIRVSGYSIERGFLANNYSVTSLEILPQARLMPESFANCHSLTSVDLTDSMALEIPDNCFNNCMALQTVRLPSLDSIGSYAFSNCSSLTSVNIPDGVDILSYAFAWCYSLESIVLPQNIMLDYGVFMGCYNLFEVYNLSGLDLSNWDSTGYAGAYALKIYDNTSELSQVVKFKDGQGFKYALCDGKAHLYGFDGDERAYYNVNSTVTYNNNSYPCSIHTGAFAQFQSNYNVILSKQVAFDDESNNVLDNYPNIYFCGTQSEWDSVIRCDYPWWNSLYFQADCVHEDGNKWAMINDEIVTYPSFDYAITKEATCTEEGEEERTCHYCGEKFYSSIPTTSHSYVDTVIEQPTCTEEGTLKHVCSVCGDEVYETIRPSGRHNIVDGICTECGVRVIQVTQENISDYFLVDTDPAYPFEWRDGVLVSTNQGCSNTRSSITLTARDNYQISIIYTVSSENGYDYLTIEANGTEIVRVAGTDIPSQTASVNMLAGNKLTFAYTKDGSADNGEDTGKILTIYIYERS